MLSKVHIIDSNWGRRAQVARDLFRRNFHAEIYDGIEEFFGSDPGEGVVFVCAEELASLEAVQNSPTTLPVVAYAEKPTTEDIVGAMHQGAVDFLNLPLSDTQVDAAVQRIAQQPDRKIELLRRETKARSLIDRLTPRERDVLLEILKGSSNKLIGRALGISPRTVEIHRGNMMRKLNAGSTAAAVRIALVAGLEEAIQEAA